MFASTTRPVRHSIPLPLSIVGRPHEAGLIRSWRADSLALVWLDPGITPCCKSRKSNDAENLVAHVFRCSPNNGHRQDTSACTVRANAGRGWAAVQNRG